MQLTDQRLHTPWQQKLFTKLLGLQYRIVYKPGSSNRAADALSRNVAPTSSCAAISVVKPTWIQEVIDGYASDPATLAIISKLIVDSSAVPRFTLRDGLLRYDHRIWIGAHPAMHQKILATCHSSALGGHSGFPNTYTRMKQLFA